MKRKTTEKKKDSEGKTKNKTQQKYTVGKNSQ